MKLARMSETPADVKTAAEHFSVLDPPKTSFLLPMVFLPYLAAVILSLISFHTTYFGMRSFYGLGETGGHGANRISDPIANSVSRYLTIDIENLFAISFAAVVQGGILLASAYLFHLLLRNRSQKIEATGSRWLPYFVSTILLLLLPISIVFSYGARLEWQIGAEQKETIQSSGAYSDATSMMNTLKIMIAEERQRLSKTVTELPAFGSWLSSMDQLTKAVAYAPDAMRAYLRSTESAEAEKRSAARSRQAETSQQTLQFQHQADLVKSELEAIAAGINKLEPLARSNSPVTADFDTKIAQYEAEMKKEKDGTGSCGPAGEGGCFKRYKVERDKAVREKAAFVESAEASVRAADDRLTALKKDKIAKEVELENILDKARLAGREIEIDPRTNSLDVAAELPKKIADLQSTVGQYGVELRQALNDLRNEFTPDKYARVGERCRKLLPLTLIGETTQPLTGIDCEPTALTPSMSALQEFLSHEKKFEDDCEALPPFVGGSSSADYTARVFDRVNSCIELSGLGALEIYRSRIADLTDRLSKSVSNRSAGVDYLTFTTGELRDGKRVAFLALFFAIAVDALVLVFTFLGQVPQLSAPKSPISMPLSNEERQRMFADLRAASDALDTSRPSSFQLPRAMFNCLETEKPDGISRLNLNTLVDESDRQSLRRRLIPFLTSSLAWDDRQQRNVVCLSDRAMSLLAHECRRLIALEEESTLIAEPLEETLAHSRLDHRLSTEPAGTSLIKSAMRTS